MPCRENPTIGAMQYAARAGLIDDVQGLSLFARRRRQGGQPPAPTAQEWASLRQHFAMLVREDETLTPTRRARLLEKIEGPEAAARIPDGPTYAALDGMRLEARSARSAMDNLNRQLADRWGTSAGDIQAQVRSLAAENRSWRRGDQPPGPPETLPYDAAGIPEDRGTRWAYSVLATHSPQTFADTTPEQRRSEFRPCDECGQFTGRNAHACPSGRAREPAMAAAPAGAAASEESQELQELLETLSSMPATPATEPQAPAVRVREVLREEAVVADEATERARTLWAETYDGSSYAADMREFQEDWDEIKARRRSGDTSVTFMTENVTAGLSSRENGRAIGLEIEIDFPDDTPDARDVFHARRRFAAALYREGLSQWEEPLRWRGLRDYGGYTDEVDRWSAQFDATVDDLEPGPTGRRRRGQRGVEVVSPILYDTPETWHNVRRIIELARAEGAAVTPLHGLHVNIDGSDFNHTLGNHTTLLRMAQTYEDTLLRCGTNPETGPWHRGREYCMPPMVPSAGYRSIGQARDANGHHQMISLTGMPAEREPVRSSTRLEFRHFDGTLDPGRVQAHTKTALAMAAAAKRGADLSGLEPEPAGTHRGLRHDGSRMPRLTGEAWEADTQRFRMLADTLFARREDKRQFLELFASNRWQRSH